MDELERLIAEQARDLKDGGVQRPEPGVDRLSHYEDRLDATGSFVGEVSHEDRLRIRWECLVHGIEYMTEAPPSWRFRGIRFWCAECNRERMRRYRQLKKPWLTEKRRTQNREEARRYRARKKEAS